MPRLWEKVARLFRLKTISPFRAEDVGKREQPRKGHRRDRRQRALGGQRRGFHRQKWLRIGLRDGFLHF